MIVIITLYCAAILRNRSIALSVGGVLTAIYGVLYLILKAEDFALLGGTLLLLVGLLISLVILIVGGLVAAEVGGMCWS